MLKGADGNKKWKCKLGERQAVVVLQLTESSVIRSIDVGNEYSAFIEILVGSSSSPQDDFKVCQWCCKAVCVCVCFIHVKLFYATALKTF